MPFYKFDDLRLWTGGAWKMPEGSARKTDIRGFSADSRKMEKDFAFVALKGAVSYTHLTLPTTSRV